LAHNRPGIYRTILDKENKDVVCTKGEATHKAKQEDRVLYDVLEKETAKFFACAVLEIYLLALCEGPTMYMCNVTAMMVLVQLQKNATGNHEINIMALQDAMCQYHYKYNTMAE
jgi:hypothetical protein